MENTYECKACGMAIKAQCAKCDSPLEHDEIKLDSGKIVQVSKCPTCEGMIKSPQCCGEDMSCNL